MIHNQPTQESIRYTNGKKINLKLLKAQIDRKMLKINMLINNMTDFSLSNFKQKQQTLRNQGIQTDRAHINIQNENLYLNPLIDQTYPKYNIDLESSQPFSTKKILGQTTDSLRNKSNFALEMTKTSFEDVKTKKAIQQQGVQTFSQSGFEFYKIDEIKYISPIKFIKYPQTDRTQKSFSKKANDQHRVLASLQKMIELQAQVNENINKNRKQVSDLNLRHNLIKKIQDKFKASLQKQKNL